MTDFLFYILFSVGLLSGIILTARAGRTLAGWECSGIIGFLTIRFAYCFLKLSYLVLLAIHCMYKTEIALKIFSYKYGFDAVFAGVFSAYIIFYLSRAKARNNLDKMLIRNIRPLFQILKYSIAITYLGSSLGLFLNYQKALDFFRSCGYQEWFMLFIIGVEFSSAFGVLFPKTRRLAISLLVCDMFGAIFTHFHNYFSTNMPDPFGNSLPAIAMLTFLSSFILLPEVPFRILKTKCATGLSYWEERRWKVSKLSQRRQRNRLKNL
jgi:hypothetical protein